MPMPNSSTATIDSCAFCALASAASFATSGARSQGTRNRGGIRLATLTCRSDPLAAAAPARLEAVFLPRGVFGRIKRELRRRSSIEAVIGHMKAEGHLGRCYLKDARRRCRQCHPQRRRLQPPPHSRLAEDRLRVILLALLQTFTIRPALKPAS